MRSRDGEEQRLDAPLFAGATRDIRHELEGPHGHGYSPEATTSCWGRLTFSWLNALIAEAYQREKARQAEALRGEPVTRPALTEADLSELRPDDAPEVVRTLAEATWRAESNLPNSEQSLRRCLWRAFGKTYLIAGCYKFMYDTLQMAGPYVLRLLLRYIHECRSDDPSSSVSCSLETGLGYVGLCLLVNLLQTVLLHQYFHACFRTGMRLNCAIINLVYAKSLRIGGPGQLAKAQGQQPGVANGQAPQQQQRTSGEVVNLMSVDAQRLQDATPYLQTLWSGPYQIIMSLCFLSAVVGWSCLAGVVVMCLQVPTLAFFARRIKLAQRKLMAIKDERIKVTNETFGAMRLLKMYGWEDSFEARLTAIRERELKQLRTYQIINIVSTATYQTAPIFTGIATFTVYSLLYGELDPATAFTALALFNVLRFPMAMFPQMVSTAVEGNVAVKRICDFLQTPEIPSRASLPSLGVGMSPCANGAGLPKVEDANEVVVVEQANLTWPDGTPLLRDLSFKVPAPRPKQAKGHMTVVLGAVGAGKSGLLQALIGDLSPDTGRIAVSKSIAYAAQVAWIRNATVKENIIFHHPYDEQRYRAVLEACCLQPDLAQWPSGDMTEIGEKGVTLSGGQKQRVSLARAVYANASLLLLDDVLSAVDAEVAKKLLAMLRGPLVRDSSIVLCTHHVAAAYKADQVILVEKARGVDEDVSPSVRAEARAKFVGSGDDFRIQYSEEVVTTAIAEWDRKTSRVHSGDNVEEIQEGPEAKKKSKGEAPEQKKEAANSGGRLVEAEAEQVGAVTAAVYRTYIEACGGYGLVVAVLGGIAVGQTMQTSADAWISFWSDHSKDGDPEHVSGAAGLLGYIGTSLVSFAGVISASALFRITALKASRFFHINLVSSMLRLPMSFYDTTPLGRVINRFSKDIYTIDEPLQSSMQTYFVVLTRVVATIAVIAVATPWFMVVVFPMMWFYRWTQNYYLPSSRQLKRMESTLRSPIFAHFSETLDGGATIRAFGQQDQLREENIERLRRTMRAYYLNVASNRWLAVRLETVGTGIVVAAATLAVLARKSLSAGVAGLSVSYALSVTQSLNWVVRMTSDREINIVSVERVREYIALTPEPPHRQATDPAPGSWPQHGAIVMENIQMRYRPELPLVLTGLDLRIEAQEKVGICGRTGAGKSSVLLILLRIVEPEVGRILIDGVDISKLGLHRLRQSLTIIPQDPVFFSGTLRFNLDPLQTSNDRALWQAMERAHLRDHAVSLVSGSGSPSAGNATQSEADGEAGMKSLDVEVAEQGLNFSLGQRQQLCLARALLRSNKILLLDEATSSLDTGTDRLIQETIRQEFASHTVLCIAHRISTIMQSDKVCVLDGGKVLEIGKPQELMSSKTSRFRQLADADASH